MLVVSGATLLMLIHLHKKDLFKFVLIVYLYSLMEGSWQ